MLIKNMSFGQDEKSLVQEAMEIERFLKTSPNQQWSGFFSGGQVNKHTIWMAKNMRSDLDDFARNGYGYWKPDDLDDAEIANVEKWGRQNWPKLKKMFDDFIAHASKYSLDSRGCDDDMPYLVKQKVRELGNLRTEAEGLVLKLQRTLPEIFKVTNNFLGVGQNANQVISLANKMSDLLDDEYMEVKMEFDRN